jgi:hypothetical protein
MTRLRLALVALVVALPLLALPVAVRAVWEAGWSIGYMDGRCWGQLCYVSGSDGRAFGELSWAEYTPPLPVTVPLTGASSWGGPPTYSSTSAGSAGP